MTHFLPLSPKRPPPPLPPRREDTPPSQFVTVPTALRILKERKASSPRGLPDRCHPIFEKSEVTVILAEYLGKPHKFNFYPMLSFYEASRNFQDVNKLVTFIEVLDPQHSYRFPLEILNLSNLGIGDDQFIQILERCHKLVSLDLSFNPMITDVSLQFIAQQFPPLTSLNLSNSIEMSRLKVGVTDEGLHTLGACIPTLKTFILRNFNYRRGDQGLEPAYGIKNLIKRNTHLEEIDLTYNKTTDDILNVIGQYCSKLNSIHLGWSHVTYEGLHYLGKKCRLLKFIDLRWCQRIEGHEYRKLVEDYPQITFIKPPAY